jgi:pimeloyl-ACP methyl ester carboxylesterase
MTESPVRDEYAELNGLRLHYRDWGDPAAPPLLLLHGFTGHARSWDSFAGVMAAKYRVLALDQRGHGESAWADDYSADAMVSDVAAFVGALGLRSYSLLGLSMGGRNAYQFASGRPAGLERLVIVDIGPEIVAAGSQRISQGVQATDVFASPEDALAAARRANPRADEVEHQHRVRNNLMLTTDGRWTYRYDRVLRSPNRPLQRPDTDAAWAMLPKINVPTLLVRGELSDVLGADTAERMLREIPDCRFALVPDAGHSIPLENPRGFLEAVQTFL